MDSHPIRKRKLYQEVQTHLLQRIQSGELQAGEQLPPERELMVFYGVGRPAVREALQALARAGIVEISQGERARVVVPTAQDLIQQIAGGARHLLQRQPETLEHLKSARLFLEEGTARMAADAATPADVARLRRCIVDHRASFPQVDELLLHDMMFHREIAAISGNPIYPAVVDAVFQWASDYYRPLVRVPGAEQLTLEEHTALVDAIEAHDPDGAVAAMRAHLTRSSELYGPFVEGRTPPQ